MARTSSFRATATLLAAAILALAVEPRPSLAQASKAPAFETNIDGISVEVAEAVRKEGVLTMKLRYRNTGSAPVRVSFAGSPLEVDNYYVVGGKTKYLVLKDDKKVALMTPLNIHGQLHADVKPAGTFLFWAKYPAPPAEVKKVTLHTPHGPPFEDIAIAEAQ